MTIKLDQVHELDLEVARSNTKYTISQPKRSVCNETKSKYIDWTSTENIVFHHGHDFTLNRQRQISNLLYLLAYDPIAMERNMNVSIEH